MPNESLHTLDSVSFIIVLSSIAELCAFSSVCVCMCVYMSVCSYTHMSMCSVLISVTSFQCFNIQALNNML